jgi:hypothetical protein
MLITSQLIAQEKYTISGTIFGADNDIALVGASVVDVNKGAGVSANISGAFSISLPTDTYTLKFSFIGYQPQQYRFFLAADTTFKIRLVPTVTQVEEVKIVGDRNADNVKGTNMGSTILQMETIKKIPSFMGEIDLLKTIQLLPGVQGSGEGQTGFNVRGGGIDQNLVLLDDAPIYNPSHFLGFFSVFNADAIKDLELYKGGIPARYGGRLSSILDVRMKDGDPNKFNASGGIGLISSRLYLDGPIKKNKGSFMIAGRRTYADAFLFLAPDEDIQDSRLFFYDLNAKADYQINEKNSLYLSAYLGRDVLSLSDQILVNWGNATTTLRWNKVFSDKLVSNFSGIVSNFDYQVGIPDGSQEFTSTTQILNYQLKADFNYFLNDNHTVQFGAGSIFHTFKPVEIEAGGESFVNNLTFPESYALEHHAYLSDAIDWGGVWSFEAGLRLSIFQNVGSGTVYSFDDSNPEEYVLQDSVTYGNGEVYNTFANLEPRLSVRYLLNEFSSLKANYQRTAQYIQQAVNSTSSSPFNSYFASGPNIKPQLSDQVSVGYFRNFKGNQYEFSAEAYYKTMQNVIDFEDHAEIFFNRYVEGEIRVGLAEAYGLELMLQKSSGKLNGWVSYTLSRAERDIPEINEGNRFLAPYNRTHDVSVVVNYELSDRWQFGLVWVFASGRPITVPNGKFEYRDTYIPTYSDRNTEQMPSYHRLDLSATYFLKDKMTFGGKVKWQSNLNFSLFNAYNRFNAFTINFKRREGTQTTFAEKVYFFGIVPSITYNFKF